jgi:hypothetical protein
MALMTLRELNDDIVNDDRWPTMTPDGQVRLSADETIRWRGRATVSESRRHQGQASERVWSLTEPADILVTDQRLVFSCAKFQKGSTWFGFGMIGAPVALAATGISHARAARRRQGKVAVGQIRFEWPLNVTLQTQKVLGSPTGVLSLTCVDEGATTFLHLTMTRSVTSYQPDHVAADVAQGLASDIARFRLSLRAASLEPAQLEELQAQRDAPAATVTGESLVYRLPGALRLGARTRQS